MMCCCHHLLLLDYFFIPFMFIGWSLLRTGRGVKQQYYCQLLLEQAMIYDIPNSLRRIYLELHSEVITLVSYKAAKAGIMTGILLAVELVKQHHFYSALNQFFSVDMNNPIANLPVVIFRFAMSPYEDWHVLAWGGALFLTLFCA